MRSIYFKSKFSDKFYVIFIACLIIIFIVKLFLFSQNFTNFKTTSRILTAKKTIILAKFWRYRFVEFSIDWNKFIKNLSFFWKVKNFSFFYFKHSKCSFSLNWSYFNQYCSLLSKSKNRFSINSNFIERALSVAFSCKEKLYFH